MANTYVKIRQLEPSASPSSLIYTNGSNTPIYFAPSTGADRILFWDNSASSIAWLDWGAGLTISGTTITANVQSVNGFTGAVVLTTTNVAEGTNLYYTDERVDDRVAALLQAGSGITLTYNDAGNTLTISATGTSGYSQVQEEGGTSLVSRSILNFVGSAITATDDGSSKTVISTHPTVNSLASNTTTGILAYTASNTITPRTITGTSARVSVTNGNGVSGNPTIDIDATYVGQSSITTLGTITTGVWQGTPVATDYGGLPIGGGVGEVLTKNSISDYDVVWAAVGSGTVTDLTVGNLSPLFTSSVATSTTTPAITFTLSTAAANTYFGNATGSTAAPSHTAAGALTKTDDTNVTLTLGGNPATSLLRATSLTLGWTGTLAATRGGTGTGTTAVGDVLVGSAGNTWTKLTIGANNTVLKSNGTTASWGTLASTNLSDTAGIAYLANTQTFTGNNTFNNVISAPTAPTAGSHLTNKTYVDSLFQGVRDYKESVRVASNTNVSATYSSTGGTSTRGQFTAAPNTLNGITLAANDRILLKDQSFPAQNGIWVVTTLGTGSNGVWDRAADFDSDAEVTSGATVYVSESSTQNNRGTYVLTNYDPIIIGGVSGTNLTFTLISSVGGYTAGSGLTLTGLDFNVGTASASRIVVNANDIDLATTAVTLGSYGSATQVATFTVDSYGRLTAAGNTTIAVSSTAISDFTEAVQDVMGAILVDSSTIDWTYNDGANTLTIATINNTSTQKVRVSKAGTLTGTRQEINFIEGSGITITTSDNGGSDRVDVTIASSSSGTVTRAFLEGSTSSTVSLNSGTAVTDVNGSNISFTTPTDTNKLFIYRNGIRQRESSATTPVRDYSVNTGTHVVTFVVALQADESVLFEKLT